jgi:hypothetical protein
MTHNTLRRIATVALGPVFTLDVVSTGELVRRIVVLAPSSEAALFKGSEQLEDGETLSFCLSSSAQR